MPAEVSPAGHLRDSVLHCPPSPVCIIQRREYRTLPVEASRTWVTRSVKKKSIGRPTTNGLALVVICAYSSPRSYPQAMLKTVKVGPSCTSTRVPMPSRAFKRWTKSASRGSGCDTSMKTDYRHQFPVPFQWCRDSRPTCPGFLLKQTHIQVAKHVRMRILLRASSGRRSRSVSEAPPPALLRHVTARRLNETPPPRRSRSFDGRRSGGGRCPRKY